MSSTAPATPPKGRIAQIRETYRMARRVDPRLGLILLTLFVGILVLFLLIGWLTGLLFFFGVIGFPLALLATTFVFGRRAERAAYSQVEGKPGAAASVLSSLRSGWFVTPAVAVNRNQDLVHRVLGRPGVVLVSEGPSTRALPLLANERKRTARFVGEGIPIIEVQCGDGEGQIPLRKLQREVMKMPRALKPAQVNAIRKRLDALTATPLPIPKGPLPKNARMPRG